MKMQSRPRPGLFAWASAAWLALLITGCAQGTSTTGLSTGTGGSGASTASVGGGGKGGGGEGGGCGGVEQVAGDCKTKVCQNGAVTEVTENTDVPDDGKLCTVDSCSNGEPTLTPVAAGAECADDGGKVCDGEGQCVECLDPSDCAPEEACSAAHTCVPASCADGVKNGAETDVDCGGGCGRCGLDKACAAATDCSTGSCTAGRCGAPQLVLDGGSRRWSDGTLATACHSYKNPGGGYSYSGATGDGRYSIDTDGAGAEPPFDVYCDMTTADGGWTLVDNDASPGSSFTTREPGANPDISVTRGSYLPAYPWSAQPQLLCKSSVFTGNQGWLTLNALGDLALEYPTRTTPVDATYAGQWSYEILNGNTQQGTEAWLYRGSGRFGSVWIGRGSQPTCACDYYAPSPETGLGRYEIGNGPTCSTWVR